MQEEFNSFKIFIENGLIHECMTEVTGKTVAENLANIPDLNDGQDVIHEIQKALKPTGNIHYIRKSC